MPKFSVRGIWQRWRESYPTNGTKADDCITVFTGVSPSIYDINVHDNGIQVFWYLDFFLTHGTVTEIEILEHCRHILSIIICSFVCWYTSLNLQYILLCFKLPVVFPFF